MKYGDLITKIITLLSDFGLKDGYVAQMKGVISSLCTAQILDITHDIQPYNILHGAFILSSIIHYFPKNTIHVAVVDPGVGTDRKGIIISTDKQIFIGPDNGLLIPAASRFKKLSVYEITNEKYMQRPVSNTFHGRDIFASVAAHVFNKVSFDEIGEKITRYVDVDLGHITNHPNSIIGKIMYIDHFGNCVTNICKEIILQHVKYDDKIQAIIGGHSFEVPFKPSYALVKKDEMVLTIGSSNYVEISVNQDSAAEKLRFCQQEKVEIFFD